MKKVLIIFALLLALSCDCLGAAKNQAREAGAENNFKALTAGREFKCEYFSLVIPKGWVMPRPPNNRKDGVSAVFATADEKLAVTLNVFKSGLTPEKLAQLTAENMRKSGLKIKNARKIGKFQKIIIDSPVAGQAWFGSHNGLCSAAVMLGPNSQKGEIILKAARPAGLFPSGAASSSK